MTENVLTGNRPSLKGTLGGSPALTLTEATAPKATAWQMGSRHQNALEEVEARPGAEPPPPAGAVGVRGLFLNSTSILLSPHIRLSCSQPHVQEVKALPP